MSTDLTIRSTPAGWDEAVRRLETMTMLFRVDQVGRRADAVTASESSGPGEWDR